MGPPPGTLEDRRRTLGRTALASLPAAKRHHAAAAFDSTASDHLVTAMRAWVDALGQPLRSFADSLLAGSQDDPEVHPLRHAAEMVAKARDHGDMREASDALAAGMQAVGLDRWRRRLRDFAEQAQFGVPPLRRGETYQFQLQVDVPRFRTVAIDFDPRDVPLTPAAARLDTLLKAIAETVIQTVNAEILKGPPGPRGSRLHLLFAREVESMHLPGVEVESSYDDAGNPDRYAGRGSLRTDVIFRNPLTHRIEGIWDWKVGGAFLGLKRAQDLSERLSGVVGKPELPGYRIPVRELHVDPQLIVVPSTQP